MEAARLATSRRFDVITATCSVVDAHSEARVEAPLAPLRPLLCAVADRCVTEGRTTAERLLGRRVKVLVPYEPALRQVPGFRDQPDALPLPPDADRQRTLADVVETIGLYMAGRPLLLVIDDVQWADDLTVAVLAMLRDGFVHRHPLVVLTACRSEERRQAIDQLVASPNVTTVDVARLNAETVKVIVSDMLAMPDPPWALVRLLERDSQGNPFFVGEYLRGAVEAGFLRRSAHGDWYVEATDHIRDPIRGTLPISSSLRNVILRRLAALDDVARDLVEAGAALGREFDVDFAAELAGIPADHRVAATATLLRRQILESPTGRHLRFVHDKLREIAYEGIAATRKVTLHRRAGEAMETAAARGDERIDYSAAALAHHWFGAGDKGKASGYFGDAGRRALEAGAYADAHLHLVKALMIDEERGGAAGRMCRAQWRRMLAVASYGIGDLEASISQANDSLVGLGERAPRSPRGWLGVTCVEVLRRLLQRTARVGMGNPGDTAAPDDVAAEAALASAQLATSYFHRTETLATIANLVRGMNRSERAGIDALVVESSSRVAYVAAASGLRAIANRHFRRAEEVGRRGATPRELGVALYLRAQDATGQGKWHRAQTVAQEAIGLLDEIGDRSEAEVARAIAAHAYFYSARFAEADVLLNDILRSAQDRAHEQHMAWARFLLGRTQLALGRSAQALPLLAEARPVLLRLQDFLSLSMCEGLMTIALWREGQRVEARQLAEVLVSRLDEGMRARVPHTLDAYAGLLEYLFEITLQEARGSRPDGARVHRYLRRHGRIFPLALPGVYRTRGWQEWAVGNRARAVRAWRKAVRSAMQLGMWHEAARSHEQLARFSSDAAEAERSSAIADGVLTTLRTTGHAAGAS
jgi:tetratricopeptide (TPR) repeat protein